MSAGPVVEGAERSARHGFDESHDSSSCREALAFWNGSRQARQSRR